MNISFNSFTRFAGGGETPIRRSGELRQGGGESPRGGGEMKFAGGGESTVRGGGEFRLGGGESPRGGGEGQSWALQLLG